MDVGDWSQVGEVTRLAVVEKIFYVYLQCYNPRMPGWSFSRLLLQL